MYILCTCLKELKKVNCLSEDYHPLFGYKENRQTNAMCLYANCSVFMQQNVKQQLEKHLICLASLGKWRYFLKIFFQITKIYSLNTRTLTIWRDT